MTDIKTFRARSMREALQIVKAELGPEAVILHTRQIPGKRLLPWQQAQDEVEITAGIGINVRSHSQTPQPVSPPQQSVSRSLLDQESSVAVLPPQQSSETGISLELSLPARQPAAFRSPVLPDDTELPPRPVPAAASKTSGDQSIVELARQVESIQGMLQQLGLKLGDRSKPASVAEEELPESLETVYQNLLDEEVPKNIAGDLVGRLKTECTPAQLEDPAALKAFLTALVEQEISVGGPIQLTPGKRKVVALIGATGVGKTTTIAKLAANFRLRNQVKMGLVTVDTYRIAAVEQLRTYAEIIDLPMKVVTNPLEMRRALDELVGLDLVLIDTAGRSPRDELQIQELKRLLVEARVDEVHLVLSLTSSLRSLLASAEKFASANATSLILTKLDEAAGLGNLLALAEEVPLPISYLTTGQDVPGDIEPARADRLARLILGTDKMPH